MVFTRSQLRARHAEIAQMAKLFTEMAKIRRESELEVAVAAAAEPEMERSSLMTQHSNDAEEETMEEKAWKEEESTQEVSEAKGSDQDVGKKRVGFSLVQVRENGVILGDHPCCMGLFPVSLAWTHTETRQCGLDEYEMCRKAANYDYSVSGVMEEGKRWELISNVSGVSSLEVTKQERKRKLSLLGDAWADGLEMQVMADLEEDISDVETLIGDDKPCKKCNAGGIVVAGLLVAVLATMVFFSYQSWAGVPVFALRTREVLSSVMTALGNAKENILAVASFFFSAEDISWQFCPLFGSWNLV